MNYTERHKLEINNYKTTFLERVENLYDSGILKQIKQITYQSTDQLEIYSDEGVNIDFLIEELRHLKNTTGCKKIHFSIDKDLAVNNIYTMITSQVDFKDLHFNEIFKLKREARYYLLKQYLIEKKYISEEKITQKVLDMIEETNIDFKGLKYI